MATTEPRTGYAPVNGLEMYYEIHGEGAPLLLLHGAYMTIDLMDAILPGLAASRQVIAVEQQGHGHTADIDRPITYEQMADDSAALLDHLGVEQRRCRGLQHGWRHRAADGDPSSRRWCARWSSHPPRTPATACTPWRSRCSRRSHPRCSPARRSRRPTSATHRILGTFPSWSTSSNGSTRRRSRGRRTRSGQSSRPH